MLQVPFLTLMFYGLCCLRSKINYFVFFFLNELHLLFDLDREVSHFESLVKPDH